MAFIAPETITHSQAQDLYGVKFRKKERQLDKTVVEVYNELLYEREDTFTGKTARMLADKIGGRIELIQRSLQILKKKGLAKQIKPWAELVESGVVSCWSHKVWFKVDG